MRKTTTNWLPARWQRALRVLPFTALLSGSGIVSNAQYCVPANGGAGCGDDIITNFTLGTINNTSTCINAGYGDYSSISTDLPNLPSANVASVTSGTGSLAHGISIWIDFNNNQTFETSERVATTGNNVQPSTTTNLTLNFTNATLGSHRLRVIYRYAQAGTSHDPCAGYSGNPWQDVEDYTVNIVPASCTPPSATFTVAPNCANNQFSVSVNLTNMGSASSIAIKEGATTFATATATGTYTAGPFTSGTSHTITLEHNVNTLCNLTSAAQTYTCPPVNDECAGAIAFPNILNNGACVSVVASTASATQSLAGCAGTADDDVWYSFVNPVGNTKLLFANTDVSGNSDRVIQFFSGTCGSLTSILCSDDESGSLTGLTPGQTYYFRIYTYGSGNSTNVSVCLKTPPPNDEAAGALPLTTNTGTTCTSTTTSSTSGATQSSEAAPTCSASGINDDVWFTFVASAPNQTIAFSSVSSNTMVAALYSGTPGSLTFMTGNCASTTLNATGLNPGATYYIRAYTTSSSSTTTASFTICVSTPPSMSYVSSTTTQPSTDAVTVGSVNQQILRTQVVVTGANSPMSLTQLSYNTTGTTNAANIANARVYYSGTSTTLDINTQPQFGTTVANPNGTFTVNGSQVLAGGGSNTNNYFWLVYDIACSATVADSVDAQCTAITVGGSSQTPTQTNPSGNRKIAAATGYATIADGNWNNPAIWTCGNIPPNNTAAVTINNNVTVASAGNIAGNITVAAGKSLIISSGDLTMGTVGGGNRTLTVNGTLTITNGALNVNGNVVLAAGCTFNMSGGNFNIDPNNGTSAGSVASGTVIFSVGNSTDAITANVNGGTILINDPPFAGSSYSVGMYTNVGMIWAGNTIQFGGSTGTNTSANGFNVECYVNSNRLSFGNVIVNGGSAARIVTDATYGMSAVNTLTITEGSELKIGATSFSSFAGDIINNGTLTVTGSMRLEYPAASLTSALPSTNAQTISGNGVFRNAASSPTTNFTTLLVNNTHADGVTFANANSLLSGSNTGTTGTLTITSGIIKTGTNSLVLGSSPAATGTYTYTAGVVAGKLKRWIAASPASYNFNVGDASGAKTATINFTTAPTAAGSLTTEWIQGSPGTTGLPITEGSNTFSYVSSIGYWRITAGDGLTGGAYTATFNGVNVADVADYNTLTIGKRPNAAASWTLDGTYAAPTGSNANFTVSRTGINTGFSEFGILMGSVPLPVKLESFSGKNAGSVNDLSWKTAEEKNFSHFELLRSSDGKDFSKLAMVNTHGNNAGSSYAYTDERPFEGKNFYRLRIVDKDGAATFSGIVELSVKPGSGLSMSIHPNPVAQQLHINIDGKMDGKGQIQVLDIMGKVLQTIAAGSNSISVDMSNFPAGTYMIRYTDNSHQQVTKVTKN